MNSSRNQVREKGKNGVKRDRDIQKVKEQKKGQHLNQETRKPRKWKKHISKHFSVNCFLQDFTILN